MPSPPQSAFAVNKIRANMDKQYEKKMTLAKVKTGEKQPDNRIYPNKKLMDYTPVKYNSKFMNAIWGHYNRYSPHNIKSNDAAIAISSNGKTLVQAAANAAASIQQQSLHSNLTKC